MICWVFHSTILSFLTFLPSNAEDEITRRVNEKANVDGFGRRANINGFLEESKQIWVLFLLFFLILFFRN